MAGRTLTQKLLARASSGPAPEGSRYVPVKPDLVLGHDATIALLVDKMRDMGAHVRHPERLFLAADHFSPPSSTDRANILRRFLDFAEREGIADVRMMEGISHQLLVESPRCRPGSVIVGADSHTTMAGAWGAYAAGMGSTDILALLISGLVFLVPPQARRLHFEGQLPPWLRGKDLALWMIGTLGEGGGQGLSLELSGPGVPMDGRFTLCNMAVDCGAENGIWIPDARMRVEWESRFGAWPADDVPQPDADARYVSTHSVDVTRLEPQVAAPYSPANVGPVSAHTGERLHQVFIGSCAGGRLEELGDAAMLLRGRTVAKGLKVIVTPASKAIWRAALDRGWLADLVDAGAVVTNPSCGACGGVDKGLLAAGEVCMSTSNRNFRGRMGDRESRVFLGSGLVAAASALTGRITDPREVLS